MRSKVLLLFSYQNKLEINNHIIFDALHLSIIFFYEAQQTNLSSSHKFNIIFFNNFKLYI